MNMDSIGVHWFTVAYTFTLRAEWEPDDEDILVEDEADEEDETDGEVENEDAAALPDSETIAMLGWA